MSSTYISAKLRKLVKSRGQGRCEYCLTPERLSQDAFHIDHIICEKQGGSTTSENLCLSCQLCNLYKGDSIVAYFIKDSSLERLFDPRNSNWSDHFELLNTGQIFPLTKIAEGTIMVLKLNEEERVMERQFGVRLGLYTPPPT